MRDKAINFWELKQEMDALGFDTREVIDQVRQAIYNGDLVVSPFYSRDHAEVVLDFGADESGRFNLFGYKLRLERGTKDAQEQAFVSDVPLEQARKLVSSRIMLHLKEPPDAIVPLFITDVKHEQALLNQKIMNTQNAEFLKKTLLNLGFGEKLNDELDKKIGAKVPEFQLNTRNEFNGKQIDYNLHFKAGDNNEMYFFNKFDASLKNDKDESVKQSFYINKGNGVTAKEAFNLMEGRAVHKQLYNQEGEKYTAWLKLDKENLTEGGNMKFRSWNENYGYKPEEVLAGKGIKELASDQGRENLLRSLRKGNAQQITVDREGTETKYFITANPQFKTVDLYDHQMKKIKREELLKPETSNSKTQKQGTQQKEELPAKKQSKKHKQTV